MDEIDLRPFGPNDPAALVGWYKNDKDGFERVFGIELPNELAYTLALNMILQDTQSGRAVFRMIERKSEPIGYAIMTDINRERRAGRPHIYIAPAHRRYSIAATRAAEAEAKRLGFTSLIATVRYGNRRALALLRRCHYQTVPQMLLQKELT